MKTKAWQIQIIGSLVLALLFILTIPIFASRIPATLQNHLSQQFTNQGHEWVNVDVKGRNVTLTGNAPTTEESFTALKVVEKYTPVLHINDQITPRLIQPYSMKMGWDGKLLTLKGYLPDQKSYNHLLKKSYQLLDKDSVQDKLELGAGAPENWSQLVDSSLQGLLKLQRGNIEITNQSLYFSGQTPYSTKRDKIIQSLANYTQYQQKLHIVASDEKDKVCKNKFKQLLENGSVKFTSGRTTIDKSSYPLLTNLANTAALCPQSKISVEGHTDNMGSTDANIKLSQQRAQVVINWLFQHGVAEHRLNAVGYGAQQPIADNKSEEGRATNRRIEFIIKGKGDH